MRGIIFRALIVVATAFLLYPVETIADEQKPEAAMMTLEGRLIDLSCYTMGMMGDQHTKCALQCAEKGLPVGLLEAKTGKVYTVVLPAPGLAPYTERVVRITGKIHNEVLLAPSKMEMREGEIWKTVQLPSAM